MSVMRNVAVGSAVSLMMCAGAAVAQDRQPTRQPERTNQYQDQDRNRDRITDDQTRPGDFGQIRDLSSPLAQMADLSGMWEMQVTFYPEEDDDADANAIAAGRTLNGIAERRWILNGSVMLERYSFAGTGRDTLPLQELGQFSLRPATDMDRTNPNDPNRDPNRDVDRDPNRDVNRDQITRDQDRRNINDPNRTRTTMQSGIGQPSQGIVMWGYDAGADEFTVVWTDDSTSGLRCDKGTLGDDGRLTLTGQYYDPRTEDTLDTRIVIDMVSPEMQRLTMYTDAGLLSEERRHMEIVYRRAGQGAFATPDRETNRPTQPERRTP